MLLAALFGGMSIASSSTTAVHALAYPLGGKYHMPHGLSNAILLPYVMEFNRDACTEKFRDIAEAMGLPVSGLSAADAADRLIKSLFALTRDLQMTVSLRDRGLTADDIEGMVEAASKVTRLLNNNPKPMTREDIRTVYNRLL